MRTSCFVGLLWLLVSVTPARAQKASSPAVDLGTKTLSHFEVALGPFGASVGLGDRAMLGTYALPWLVGTIDRGSIVPNAWGKAEILRSRRLSLSLRSALFYTRLQDLDSDGLNVRAVIWPTHVAASFLVSKRWPATAEATWVLVRATAERRRNQDTEVGVIALANAFHLAYTQRFQLRQDFELWARGRLVPISSPILVDAEASITSSARLRVRGRANDAELTAAGSVMVGLAWTRGRFNVRAGVGYGHWVVPGFSLPVGERIPSADLNIYWRL